jgi:Tfp pilus assembly protein PilZ
MMNRRLEVMKQATRQKRFRKRLMVKFGERDFSHSGFTADLSKGGVFIVSPFRPALDTHLHLQVFLDADTAVYFEATVRRHKIVPPELRSVDKGGFGVRFLAPDELLTNVLVETGNRLEGRYASLEELQRVYEQEFKHGGVFIQTEREFPRGADVLFVLRADFANKTFEFNSTVVHTWLVEQPGPRGIGLVFKDAKEVEAAVKPLLTP